jgi:hypothetical protein
LFGVEINNPAGIEFFLDLYLTIRRTCRHVANSLMDNLAQIGRLRIELTPSGLQRAEKHNVFKEMVQAPCSRMHHLDQQPAIFRHRSPPDINISAARLDCSAGVRPWHSSVKRPF